MATDYLKALPEKQVAEWYSRLGQAMAKRTIGGVPGLAATFLLHWLDNRNDKSTFYFNAPQHLRESNYVTPVLEMHRDIFLSQQPTATGAIGGALPRLRSGQWKPGNPLALSYHSLVSVGESLIDLVRIQQRGSEAERDLLTSLRGFQLHSDVQLSGAAAAPPATEVEVKIVQWSAFVTDRYDWNYSEHFTVPNPDFGSAASDAVRPKDESLTVYHRNAERLEKAQLAAPYDIKSNPWPITGALLASASAVLKP